jgi:3-ketosteroid 9alpha-monooxygenase subunit A
MAAQVDFNRFPRGWFVISSSAELPAGKVRALKYFGQEMVLFRGEDGRAALLDAYCPHLGAHLGIGGEVVDNTVKCPFHAWRFDGATGKCVDVPYAKKIPPKACVRTWKLDERNGLIFMWHDPEGGDPDYEIPLMPEHDNPEWTDWSLSMQTIKTHPREIVENVADKAHFPEVHNTDITRFENEFTDHIAVQRTEGIAYPRAGGQDTFKLVATYYGPAYQITVMDSKLPNVLVNCHTPIDHNTLHLRFGVKLKKIGPVDQIAGFAATYVENLALGFGEDVAIWEHKVWRDRPVLCDGDGAIGKLRKWYSQFYAPRA